VDRRGMIVRLAAMAACGTACVLAGCQATYCALEHIMAPVEDVNPCSGGRSATAYHHADFHPVPTRPALAPPWMGPPSVPELGAIRPDRSLPQMPQIPSQQIEIAPPPPPDELSRPSPRLEDRGERVTGEPRTLEEGSRSWVFATPDLGRRQPVQVEALRSTEPPPNVRR
jgi:hypothetical protein